MIAETISSAMSISMISRRDRLIGKERFRERETSSTALDLIPAWALQVCDEPGMVADTNILLDVVFDRDRKSKRVMKLVEHGDIELFVTQATIDEFHSRCGWVARHAPPAHLREVTDLLADATRVRLPYATRPETFPQLLDRTDAKFLQLFLESGADFLVTRDNDLLDMNAYVSRECKGRIVKPKECLLWPWVHQLLAQLPPESQEECR